MPFSYSAFNFLPGQTFLEVFDLVVNKTFINCFLNFNQLTEFGYGGCLFGLPALVALLNGFPTNLISPLVITERSFNRWNQLYVFFRRFSGLRWSRGCRFRPFLLLPVNGDLDSLRVIVVRIEAEEVVIVFRSCIYSLNIPLEAERLLGSRTAIQRGRRCLTADS